MTRSSKVSLKFSNLNRREDLGVFLKEYRRVLGIFVDIFWEDKKIPSFASKTSTDKIQSILSATAIQCAGKQASSIVRGARRKHEQRIYMLNSLLAQGKDASKLKAVLDKEKLSKPILDKTPAQLDERLIRFDLDNKTSFDGWLNVGRTGIFGRRKLTFPFKRHAQFNNLARRGSLNKGILLSEKGAILTFDINIPQKTEGQVLGIDVGVTNSLASSDGVLSKNDVHGHSLSSILKKVAGRKKGSNGFREATTHRKNYINWSVNQLDLSNVREVHREAIKNLRRGKRTSRFLSHWTYAEMFDKLDRFCEEQGVLVRKINPAYTSQTCPRCKTLGNRRGKSFVCSCGYRNDADLNAAINLAGEHIVPRENVFL